MTVQIGTVVHFVYGDTHHAAIVTALGEGEAATLLCLPPNGLPYGQPDVPHDEAATPGTWHYIEA